MDAMGSALGLNEEIFPLIVHSTTPIKEHNDILSHRFHALLYSLHIGHKAFRDIDGKPLNEN